MGASIHDSSHALGEFRSSYREHHGFVWHALHRFGLQPISIEDAVQDVFMVAYRRRDVRHGRSTKAWLYGIARRVASNHRRADRRHAARVEALAQTAGPGPRPIPEAIVELDRHLAALSSDDRELFVLSELEGLSGPEIAKLLGRNVNTVYTRIRKLRTDLPCDPRLPLARRARPRASNRGWAALLPMLNTTSLVKSTGLTVGVGGGTALGASLGAVAVAAVVGWSATRRPEAPAPNPVASVPSGHAAPEPSVPPRPPSVESLSAAVPVAVSAQAPVPPPHRTAPDLPSRSVVPESASPRRGVRSHASAPPRASRLAAENALLEDANEALREHDYATALRRSNEHATAFPQSVLADVGAVVRIRALCGLRKTPQARAEAKLLTARHPTMAVLRRLAKSCAVAPRDPTEVDTTGT